MTANLTPRQRKALETLLTTGNVKQAAEAAHVSRETIYRWLEQDTFRAALDEGERAAIESLTRALVGLGDLATATLRDAMTGDDIPPAQRVRAADVVLGRLLQLRELIELETRVCELERMVFDGNEPK